VKLNDPLVQTRPRENSIVDHHHQSGQDGFRSFLEQEGFDAISAHFTETMQEARDGGLMLLQFDRKAQGQTNGLKNGTKFDVDPQPSLPPAEGPAFNGQYFFKKLYTIYD
jgi:hypothetical protein